MAPNGLDQRHLALHPAVHRTQHLEKTPAFLLQWSVIDHDLVAPYEFARPMRSAFAARTSQRSSAAASSAAAA
jgi:hypothetical protein